MQNHILKHEAVRYHLATSGERDAAESGLAQPAHFDQLAGVAFGRFECSVPNSSISRWLRPKRAIAPQRNGIPRRRNQGHALDEVEALQKRYIRKARATHA
jgi:hypothetical protein